MLQRRVCATFLFYMETYNTTQTIGLANMWRHIGMEKEKKKSFSHTCGFLFSINTCKAIQTIDKVWHYKLKLRKRRFFFFC